MILDVVEFGLRWAMRAGGVRARDVGTSVGRIRVYDLRGSPGKPTLVLLHGIGANATTFWPLFLGLRKVAGRVLALDNLGHGRSHRPDELDPDAMLTAVNEVLDAELQEPAVLVGNSLGGAIALRYALRSAERVKSLVLISPAGAPYSATELDDLRGLFDMNTRAKAVDFVHRLHARPVWYARAIAADVARRFRDPAMRILLERLRPRPAMLPEEMARLPGRSLLLWGQAERILPNSAVDFFRAHLPGVVETPEGWGHCPQIDRPRPLIRRIRRWLEEGG